MGHAELGMHGFKSLCLVSNNANVFFYVRQMVTFLLLPSFLILMYYIPIKRSMMEPHVLHDFLTNTIKYS